MSARNRQMNAAEAAIWDACPPAKYGREVLTTTRFDDRGRAYTATKSIPLRDQVRRDAAKKAGSR